MQQNAKEKLFKCDCLGQRGSRRLTDNRSRRQETRFADHGPIFDGGVLDADPRADLYPYANDCWTVRAGEDHAICLKSRIVADHNTPLAGVEAYVRSDTAAATDDNGAANVRS